MHYSNSRGFGKLVCYSGRNADNLCRIAENIFAVPVPKSTELSVPITNVPDMRHTGHAGAKGGGQNGSNICVNKIDAMSPDNGT